MDRTVQHRAEEDGSPPSPSDTLDVEQACLGITRDYWTQSWLSVSLGRQKTRANTGSSPLMATLLHHTPQDHTALSPFQPCTSLKQASSFLPLLHSTFQKTLQASPTACQLLLAPVENSGYCSS